MSLNLRLWWCLQTIKIVARTLFFVGVIAVAWLSLAPHDAIPEVDVWDKLGHFLAYAVLAVLGGFTFSAGRTGVTVCVLLMVSA